MVDELKARRDLMCQGLDMMSPALTYQKPEGAYYVFVRFNIPGMNSVDLALKLLYEAKVIVVPGRAFGPTGDNFIRLSFGGTREEIKIALDRMQDWLKTKGALS